MSRIQDIIAELCPEGIEYRSIGEVAGCHVGATPASGVTAYWTDGTIPWMSSGEVNKGTVFDTDKKITQAGYDSCSARMVPPHAVVVALAGQGKTRGKVARTRVSLCTNQSLCAIVVDETVNSDYLYHYLTTQYQQLRDVSSGEGTRGGLNLQMIRRFRIPVPPLQVQREIANVLDAFTALEDALEAELEARRTQYLHYRKSLLTPDGRQEVRSASLGELFDMRAGKPMAASAISSSQDGDHPYPCFGGGGLRGYVSCSSHDGDRVLIGRQGALCGNVKRATGKFYATEHAVVVTPRSDVDIRWTFHLLDWMNLNQYASKSAQPGLAVGALEKLRVAVPVLDEQRRIGSILDGFDTLVNDPSIGLPAEMRARRQQYGYYCDTLLTFGAAAS